MPLSPMVCVWRGPDGMIGMVRMMRKAVQHREETRERHILHSRPSVDACLVVVEVWKFGCLDVCLRTPFLVFPAFRSFLPFQSRPALTTYGDVCPFSFFCVPKLHSRKVRTTNVAMRCRLLSPRPSLFFPRVEVLFLCARGKSDAYSVLGGMSLQQGRPTQARPKLSSPRSMTPLLV